MQISPLRVRAMRSPLSLVTTVDALELDDAGLLGLDLALDRLLALDHAADVERTHRQLRARLADRLGGDDADRHAFLDQRAGGQVHAVAQPADAQRRLAGHRAADDDLVDAQLLRSCGPAPAVIISFSSTIDLVGDRVDDRVAADPAADRLGQRPFDLLALVDDALGDALRGAAVVHGDDDVLGHVGQLARQVAGVGRLQGRVGQTLAGTVRGAESTPARVRPSRKFALIGVSMISPRRLGHQTAHAGQLANLLDAAAGTGVGHQVDRVEVRHVRRRRDGRSCRSSIICLVICVAGMRPDVDDLVVALAAR